MRKLVPVLIVTILMLVTCSVADSPKSAQDTGPEGNTNDYTVITVGQLNTMLTETDLVLVNVHVPYEGEIPNTDLSIPFNQIGANLAQLADRDATIVLYCRSGGMSTTAAKELVRLGYTQVLELDGGFNAWVAAGHELVHQP